MATEKIINIMTRWRRSEAVVWRSDREGDSQECWSPFVGRTHPLPVVQPEAIVEV